MTRPPKATVPQKIERSSAILFGATLLSRISGFLRSMVLAYAFGTSAGTDAWIMASALPNLLFGAVNTSITMTTVPVMTDADANFSPSSVADLLDQVWSGLLLLSLVLVVGGELTAPWLMALLAPGFHGHQLQRTVLMTRIMIPTMVFWGTAGLMVGVLQARDVYAGPALSPLVVNLVQIAGILLLRHWFHIEGVAIGFTVAVACQVVWLRPLLARQNIRLKWQWPWNHPLARRLISLMWPFFLVSSASSVEMIIDRILASSMVVGSISAMNFSYTLSQVPMGLIIAPLTTPIFTRLSRHHARARDMEFSRLATRGLRLILLTVVPLAIGFFAFRVPILRIIYEHGAFSQRSLTMTSRTLAFFALGMPAVALTAYFQQLSFARQKTKDPARYSVAAISLNIVGNFALTPSLAVSGLVLATTLASWLNCILLWRHFPLVGIGGLALRIALAATAMSGVSWLQLHVSHLDTMVGFFPVTLVMALAATLSSATYAGVLWLFQVPEVSAGKRLAIRVMRRTWRLVA